MVTAAMFAAVTALRLTGSDETDATGLLYALPVALAAMAFGRVVGTTAAMSAAGLLVAWAAGHPEVSLSALGWAARVVPLVLLGVLVGAAADAVEEAAADRLALAVAAARRRDAAEVHDEILQRLTVAKWRLEAGSGDDAAALLDEAMSQAQHLVSSLLEDVDLDDRLRVRTPTGDPAP
jgi:signal transduction histidine kinase